MGTTTIQDGFVAEITSREPVTEVVEDVREALLAHAVVVLREQDLPALAQAAFTRLLGPLEPASDMRNHHPDSTDVMVVDNSGRTPIVGNQWWHSDRSFLPEPTHYTVLFGRTVPPSGTETVFADMVAACRRMPAPWRTALRGALGVHSYDRLAHLRAESHRAPVQPDYAVRFPPVRHPVVRLHEESGAAALYLSELCLTGVESERGTPVEGVSVDGLHAHATAGEFLYRHPWRPGDVVIWDNCRVMHRAGELRPGVARILHRTTTAGGPPLPAVPP
ncbi:TauD/TfdA family dioxygenase [Spongiactinospora sp. TRM90649]|uniref:TauD/TfdA dioxygenase family protein n=1 Tax=Spongiactinospora sp. TRM90649 TaxID=3031114 RepID=UPI0023F9D294|nr:TauD/TfdA family dioxygenase [Spongiactinospora sp. TRM90649]MDF5754302.1 TauD/TfdA family dioxygenase [Spongiactinospora sp. TRM90649]